MQILSARAHCESNIDIALPNIFGHCEVERSKRQYSVGLFDYVTVLMKGKSHKELNRECKSWMEYDGRSVAV